MTWALRPRPSTRSAMWLDLLGVAPFSMTTIIGCNSGECVSK